MLQKDGLESRARLGELRSGRRVPDGEWIAVRVDGRGFSRLTRDHYTKPFDLGFAQTMVSTARALVGELGASMAYVQSDEVSLVMPPHWRDFGRRVQKVASVAAGIASARFSLDSGHFASFDGRVWSGASTDALTDYLSWRRADANRNAINSLAYWALRDDGMDATTATAQLTGLSTSSKVDLVAARGRAVDGMAPWQRWGIAVHRERRTVMTESGVPAQRSRLVSNWRLEEPDAWRSVVARAMDTPEKRAAPPSRTAAF